MTDSIETSEREALRLFDAAVRNLPPVRSIPADDSSPAAEQPTAQRLQQLADAVRLALVFLKDDHATAVDRDLVVAELERRLGLQDATGSCCYGGQKTRAQCGSCSAWRVLPTDLRRSVGLGLYRAAVALLDSVQEDHPQLGEVMSAEAFADLTFEVDQLELPPDTPAINDTPLDEVPDSLGFAIDLLQRQPPKGWGLYRVPESDEILISKPNGDGVRIQPVRDALLYELASAMLPPEPKP